MVRDRQPDGTTRSREGADAVHSNGSAPTDGSAPESDGGRPLAGNPQDVLEVRVVALGASDGTRWLAMGRSPDGTSVTFVTDARAAERIADAMEAGDEPVVVIERRQLV